MMKGWPKGDSLATLGRDMTCSPSHHAKDRRCYRIQTHLLPDGYPKSSSPALLLGVTSGMVDGVSMKMTFLLSLTFCCPCCIHIDVLPRPWGQACVCAFRRVRKLWPQLPEGVRAWRPCRTRPCTAWCFPVLRVGPCCSGTPLSASALPTGISVIPNP